MTRIFIALLVIGGATETRAGRGASYGSIVEAIRTGNADVIASELERAERLACAECVAPVMELLDSDEPRVREVASWWFARRPMLKAAITLQSVARVMGPDGKQAERAADVLGTFRHPGVLPALAAAIARPDFPAATKTAAVRAIGTIADPDGAPAVMVALTSAAAETRIEAVRAYGTLRGHRSGAELVALLSDADVAVRRQAAASVAAYRQAGARAPLETLLAHDPDPLVRRNAAWALLKLADPAARPALERAAADDPVAYVRSIARAGLAAAR